MNVRPTDHARVPCALVLVLAAGLGACKPTGATSEGLVVLDGSSSAHPLAVAVVERIASSDPSARLAVGMSGSTAGLRKLCMGKVPIALTSRRMRPSEARYCEISGVDPLELPVARDGIAVVVPVEATWLESMTLDELRRIWSRSGRDTAQRWSDIREGWPDMPLALYGPGADSGTHDRFVAAVLESEDALRGDYTSSEDDGVLVRGLRSRPGGLGILGSAWARTAVGLRVVPIAGLGGHGPPLAPTTDVLTRGGYGALARTLHVVVDRHALADPHVAQVVDAFLHVPAALLEETGYVAAPVDALAAARAALRDARSTR